MATEFRHSGDGDFGMGFAGGLLIALSSTLLMALCGQISGISGILGKLTLRSSLLSWQLSFVLGLLSAGVYFNSDWGDKSVFGPPVDIHWSVVLIGGIFVGIGPHLSNGCTSGHGAIGLARLSPRSLVAVVTFLLFGALSAGYSRSRSVRHYIYSSGAASLPPPKSAPAWNLSLSLYFVPLSCALALILAFRASAKWRHAKQSSVSDVAAKSAKPPSKSLPIPTATMVGGYAATFSCGLIFGLGLCLSGMCNPAKVLRFLDFAGDGGWDPQLLFVLGGAVMANLITFNLMSKQRSKPLFASVTADTANGTFNAVPLCNCFNYGPAAPANQLVTWRLVVGAAVFGIGWGITGVCPGPGVVAYAAGSSHVGLALPSILVGFVLSETLFPS